MEKPFFDAIEDDGNVVWLLRRGKRVGCMHREQARQLEEIALKDVTHKP